MSIPRGLRIALLGTGAMALLALQWPALVLLGLYLMVLPGLVLMLAPSVFGYLLGFTVGYLAFARVHRVAGAIAGLAIVGAAAVGVPAIANRAAEARLAESRARDLVPATPLAAAATIAIEPAKPSRYGRPDPAQAAACDDLCLTLLYNGVASQVIMAVSPAPITYRLAQHRQCSAPTLTKAARWIEDALGPLDNLLQAVKQRLAAGECLLAEPAAEATAEVRVRRVDEVVGETPGRLSLAPGEVRLRAVEVWQGARLVARAGEASVNRIGMPLQLVPYGNFTGWEISRGHGHSTGWTAMAALRDLTGWSLSPPQAGGQSGLRRLVDAALADPARAADDSAFALVPDLLKAMEKGLAPGDVERLARLVDDPRVTLDFWWRLPAWKVGADDAAMPALRDAMLRRLLRKADPEAALRTLSRTATRLPAGAFAEPNRLLDQVIADGMLKEFGLVTRLADRGAAVADQLVEIVRATYATPRAHFPAEGAAPDAMIGLCRLGPSAGAKLPVLEQLAAAGLVPPQIQRGESWQVMLFALGADPATIPFEVQPKDRARLLRGRGKPRGCRLPSPA